MLYLPRQAFAAITVHEDVIVLPLGPLERQVVFLSLKDHARSAADETPFRRLMRRLFGQHGPNRLADPRLEALRVFCVRYRHDRSAINRQFRVNGPADRFLEPQVMLAAAQVIDRPRNPTS
jgi:hypothetical protein